MWRGAVIVAANSLPLLRTFHSYALYRRVGLTAAIYRRRDWRTKGPYVNVASLARASEAAVPLRVACAMCSF